MTYGLPYQGSKSSIAENIISALPRAEYFVDLFFGGGALTHCAMLSGKYKRYIVNDIVPYGMDLFCDAIDGKYRDEKRWVSREDFFALKDTDPYVRLCWSFGSDCRTYLYSREIEDYKHCFHMAVIDGNYTPMKERYGLDFSALDEMGGDLKQRRINVKRIMDRYFREGKIEKRGSHYVLRNQWGGVQQGNAVNPRINATDRASRRVRNRGNAGGRGLCHKDTAYGKDTGSAELGEYF